MTELPPGGTYGSPAGTAVPGQRPPGRVTGLAPGETLLHDDAAGRLTRVGTGADARLRRELRGPNAAARARHVAALLDRLRGIPGVPDLVGPVTGTSYQTRVLPGITLSHLLAEGNWRPGPVEIVDLAIGLTALIGAVHERGVLHTDLNPDTILLEPERNEPALANVDRAVLFSGEHPGFAAGTSIVHRLAHLAPEQTGRTAQPVDQRADLYALGTVLHEICTGEPLFGHREADALALMRDQLTRVPAPVTALRPDCPQPLALIIAKLLEKEPGRRYQSAAGLLHDLHRLRQATTGVSPADLATIETFTLGERDFPHQLTGPTKLCAREGATARLHAAFEHACSGPAAGILVAGQAGTGKTVLVDQIRPVVAAAGGWFVRGTCEAPDADLRADAVFQVLGAIGRLLLTEPDAVLTEQRRHLHQVLRANAALVAGLAPDLAPVLGVAGEQPQGNPLELHGRARRSAMDVLRAVASRRRPVVVVLDGLQFATRFTLSLFDDVLTGGDCTGILLIGVLDDDRLEETHPVGRARPGWTEVGLWPPAVRLDNLGRDDLGRMLAEMLRLEPREAARLADLVGPRTRGNPGASVELLNALRAEGALRLDENGWVWVPEAIVGAQLTGAEGGDLLVSRLRRLPDPTLAVLEVLSVLGPRVEPATLALAVGMPLHDLDARLEPAVGDGLVVTTTGDPDGTPVVRFRHERGRPLVRERLGADAARLLHLTVAHRLAADPGHLILAAGQYVEALTELTAPAERLAVAELLERAGRAVRATNPVTAQRYFTAGTQLLTEPSAPTDPPGTTGSQPPTGTDENAGPVTQLLLRLDLERHATAYGLGDLATMDELFSSLSRRCSDPLRTNGSVCLQIAALVNRGRLGEAIALGLDQLDRLGGSSDQQPPDNCAAAVPLLQAWASTDPDRDQHRPEVDDPWVQARALVLRRLVPAAYFADPDLLGRLVTTACRMWDEHGPQRHLVEAIAHAPIVTVFGAGDFRTGHLVLRRLLPISTQRDYEPESSHARFLAGASASPWFESPELCHAQLRQAETGLLQAGEAQAASFCAIALTGHALDIVPSLSLLTQQVDRAHALAVRTGNQLTAQSLVLYRGLLARLTGTDHHPDGNPTATDEALADEPTEPTIVLAHRHLARALIATILEPDGPPPVCPQALRPPPAAVRAVYLAAQLHLLDALSLARQLQRVGTADGPDRTDTERIRADLEQSRAWLARRAADHPTVFGYQVLWIDAELAWADGDHLGALAHFDRALTRSAPGHGWHRAVLTERTGLFRLSLGHQYGGRAMLTVARDAYQAWGATAKVEQLNRDHPFLRTLPAGQERPPRQVDALAGSGAGAPDAVDLLAVLSASQAIGRETEFDRLHARVAEVLIAITGATDVTVLLRDEDHDGEARRLVPGQEQPDQEHSGREHSGQDSAIAYPVSAVRYAERTGEPLLVADATRDDRFRSDPYLRELSCCALMVVPIRARGRTRILLVLENRLQGNGFSGHRLDTVQLIAGQLAVSFENALARRRTEVEARQREKLLETVRQREKLLETLLAIQRDIAHRVPLQQVMDAVTDGASSMLAGGFVALVMLDPQRADRAQIPAVSGQRSPELTDDAVCRCAVAAVTADDVVTVQDPGPGELTLVAAPVRVSGRIIGSLVSGAADRPGHRAWRRDLLGAFAEQVSLALNDANTLEAIQEASYDALTGLPNRPLFLERLKQALVPDRPDQEEATEVSVLFIDLDRFKAVNDTLGHGVGDELLAEVGQRLRECVRDSDTVARLGGDEFAVLIEGTRGTEPGQRAAGRIAATLTRPVRLAGRDIVISASIGLAHGHSAQNESGELLRQADLAMYLAKKSGSRRAVVFEQRMQEDARDRLELQGDLRRALAESQFELVYQPLMDLAGRRPLGVETLIRWRHPTRGMISPALFVPIAEETGVIVEIGRWVLARSCRQVATWRREGKPDLRLNINVSARQLADGGLANEVISTLAETGLPASALTLELTETVLMEDPERVTAQLSELRRLGVQVGIDDFGTGYSSLSYLRRFPVDKLKIDKSFIDNIETVEEDLAIVRTVVDLARILRLETTAEGIESAAQADLLQAVGCEVGQGYWFARPLPPQEIPGFLAGFG